MRTWSILGTCGACERVDSYPDHLARGLRNVDRHSGSSGYGAELMMLLCRKSFEPIAAGATPVHASTAHRALHHVVATAG